MAELVLDPVGYFLIRINQETKELEVAFCKYEEIQYTNTKAKFGKNNINQTFSSISPEKILNWIEDNELVSKNDHLEYIKKELYRAKECIKNKEKYIQD